MSERLQKGKEEEEKIYRSTVQVHAGLITDFLQARNDIRIVTGEGNRDAKL
jgi:hypothetical protein